MIPVLSSLSQLFTQTATEEFKKLVQPASLVAAAVLMALNLVLIFPVLLEHRVPFALAIDALGGTGQLALGTVTLLVLGYLINSLGGAFLNLVTGNAFRESRVIKATLVNWQQQKFDSLQKDLESEDKYTQVRVLHELAFGFPNERDRLAPARLGNVLASVASYTWHQYGAYLDVLWPMMDQPLKTKDAEMHTRLQQNRASLLLFTSLTTLLAVVALEVLALRVVVGQPNLAFVSALILLGAAYLVYRASVQKALDWGRDVRAAFALYLKEVETSLRLRPLDAYGKEQERKDRWKAVSWWLTHGAVEIPDSSGLRQPNQEPHWYKEAPSSLPVVVSPATISVQQRHHVLERWPKRPESAQEYRLPGRVVDYLFAVTNSDSGEHAKPAKGSFLMVADPTRLPAVPDEVEGKLNRKVIKGKRQPGDPEALLWRLGHIPVRGSRILQYEVRYDMRVRVESNEVTIDVFEFSKTSRTVEMSFRYTGMKKRALKVVATVLNGTQLPEDAQCSIKSHGGAMDLRPDIPTVYKPARREGIWTIPDVQPQSKLYLTFTFKHV